MTDQFGRIIDYMRVSVTDRCNLRCEYCMPNGVPLAGHSDILRYEEMLRVCEAAVSLGIVKFKVTGGEPLVRKGCAGFIAGLKALPSVEQVTLTTNGLLLGAYLDELCAAGIDGINISLNTLRDDEYGRLTGFSGNAAQTVLKTLKDCVERGLKLKINAVLLAKTFDGLPDIAMLARDMPVDVRFIELMPLGEGAGMEGVPIRTAIERLRGFWPDLYPDDEKRGNGPAVYYASSGLNGRIGFIGALSCVFCGKCNRARLTATGVLKPCLCYADGVNLNELLRNGCTDGELREAMRGCIEKKPRTHCFSDPVNMTELKKMNQIGG